MPVDTMRILPVRGSVLPMGAARDLVYRDPHACGHHEDFTCTGFRSPYGSCQSYIKPPLWAPPLIFPRCCLLKSFQQGDTSVRQRAFEMSFPLLVELPKAVEPYLLVCQLYCWQLCPYKQSWPTTKSLDPILVTILRVGFPGESFRPATSGFANNDPVPDVGNNRGIRISHLKIRYNLFMVHR